MSLAELPLGVLNDYFGQHCPQLGNIERAEKFAGGQSNPTYKLHTTVGEYVLRRQPPGKLLPSAHAVDREFAVIKALAPTAVPVPGAMHLCQDTDVLGSMFYVMEKVEGNIYWNAALPEIASSGQRGAMYNEMNRVLCALHDVDPQAVGLADYGKPGNYFARQIARWTKQYRASETHAIAEIESVIDYLEQNQPDDDGQVALVHGDYRLDNMIFAPTQGEGESAVVKAVLDWELSTLGHPYADLAYQCMQLRLPANLESAAGLGGLDRSTLGIPTEQEYVAQYCARRNIQSIENWPFYLVFSFFRLAAIVQGVAKRAEQGNASNERAKRIGKMVQPLAQMALGVLKQG